MQQIHFAGAGNMAYALASAFSRGTEAVRIGISDPDVSRQALFRRDFPSVRLYDSLPQLAAEADYLFIAVKPQVVPEVLPALSAVSCPVVSIAAGIPLSLLKKSLPNAPLVRVMPNTPCLVGEMAAACAFDSGVSEAQRQSVLALLSLAGTVISVDEEQMDAVTGLSGSGPAFVARFIEAFAQTGAELGLSYDDALALSLATFSGTAHLLQKKQLSPEALVQMVSSPNGTTVAGRAFLESSDFAAVIHRTIEAAAQRSRELGRGK